MPDEIEFYDHDGTLARINRTKHEYATWDGVAGEWREHRHTAGSTFVHYESTITEAEAKALIVAENGSPQDLYKTAE